jgi:6-phosphogluconolactonase
MKREIRIVHDTAELARAGACEFARLASEAVHTKDLFTVALSGGSTPKNLYSLLASDESYRAELPWNRMHFFWSDERHVPPDDPDSNYRMANEALLSKVPVPAENVHRIRGEEPGALSAAHEYEKELQNFFRLTAGQLPRFDLMLLGIGSDGHTASLFPDTPALREREHLVVANWVDKLNTNRLTLTLPVLNNAATVIFLVGGSEKSEILRAVLEGEDSEKFPAQLVQPREGRVVWLVDRDAASLLSAAQSQSAHENLL